MAALRRAGFEKTRRAKGSHQPMAHRSEEVRIVVVPLAKSEIARGTLRSILAQSGLSEEEFLELLR